MADPYRTPANKHKRTRRLSPGVRGVLILQLVLAVVVGLVLVVAYLPKWATMSVLGVMFWGALVLTVMASVNSENRLGAFKFWVYESEADEDEQVL